ncbi:MAG: adenosylcobinamide-phosphate synthase CbiB [Alphaproteobacteria bacterium]|jgi:adenosylcobinamide-phosphate synthase|uniref:adenosylcobinamide-phosphate synthase CbiB n=1 Tax=Sphingobium TaxID=165695 RepID=UPI003137B282|nr:adenosylcobinamide-phosphate synthase CbiB [Alphaproteobacteria bacterium]
MVEPVAVLALAVEAVIGWPDALHRRIGHPVGAFAAIIAWCEKTWNRPESAEGWRRLAGILCVLLLLILAVGGGLLLEQGLRLVAGRWAWIGITLMAVPGMAAGSLYRHVRAVALPLHDRRIEDARAAVGMIVGRDTARLDEAGVARAAIESLAESFCDGVVAPLFWLMLGGLPGLWAYKAINTADSLIGHREPRWRAFGWAAARLDDLLNLIPARLSGLLLCVAGGGGWGTMLRDAGRHASPNAGWPEAAMAGALHFSLAGPIAYDGVAQDKAWIGSGRSDLSADDIDAALRVYLRACLLLGLIAGLFAWRLS